MNEYDNEHNRTNQIWEHPEYQKAYQMIQKLEETRRFCGHSLEHFLDVARLAYIYNLEDQSEIPKDWIYAAALLHDIGRHEEYMNQIPHQEAGAVLARSILADCGFSQLEQKEIISAITGHRSAGNERGTLREYLYKADKKSRNCMICPAEYECNWPAEKKNKQVCI